jgi:hypothetical protein
MGKTTFTRACLILSLCLQTVSQGLYPLYSICNPFLHVECGVNGSTTSILNQNNLQPLQNCTVVSGNVFVRARGPPNDLEDFVIPENWTLILGSVFCSGAGVNWTLTSITANNLNSVATGDPSSTSLGFVISDYSGLTTLSFPNLTTVGSNVVLARNPSLQNINGFQSLSTVHGNLDLTGNFNSIDLKNLNAVNGNINIQTTSKTFTCPSFSNVTVLGSINCAGNVAEPQPLSIDNSTTTPPNITPSQVSTSATTTQGSSPSNSGKASSSTYTITRDGLSLPDTTLILAPLTLMLYVVPAWVGLALYFS